MSAVFFFLHQKLQFCRIVAPVFYIDDRRSFVVENLDNAIAFFSEIGLKMEGRAMVEGEWAGRVTGLGNQSVEIVMMVMENLDLVVQFVLQLEQVSF